MGTCASSHFTSKQTGDSKKFPTTAKVVHFDGRLQEFRRRITAAEVLSLHPTSFLCSSDTMSIGSHAPQLSEEHELQFGQIYFLMPLSKSLSPLSLQDLCALAIKASTALDITSGRFVDQKGRARINAGDSRDIVTF